MRYPLLCIKFFVTPNFLKHWRDAHEIFRHCETKNFRRKIVLPPIMHKTFRYPKFLKHWRDVHEIFRHCETKNFRRKNVIPPFSFIKLFETKNFLKNSRIPLRKFSALWDIKISTENRDMPPLIHNFFSIPENFRKTEGFLYKAFRSCETKSSDKTVMHSTEGFTYQFFRHCETKKFRQKIENRDITLWSIKFFDTR